MELAALQTGDVVDLVAPGSSCSRRELADSVRAVMELGLVPRVPKEIFGDTLLFSNRDRQRLLHLRQAIYASDSKMIWCVRGGYGAIRLMPSILKWKRPTRAKIFLGYSDITTLHQHFNQHWDWPTIYGPNVDRLGRGNVKGRERSLLLGLLFGRIDNVDYKDLRPLNAAARSGRTLRAPVVGGNMAVLQSGLGTPSVLDPRGCILFFEDVGERPHRVDRMLAQFEQAGWFKGARAVVFGPFILKDHADRRDVWIDVIPRFAKVQKIPVVCGLPVGHDPKRQWPLPFNGEATLSTGRVCRLNVDNPVCAR
jgi:muramoyltetrapeptide carboxypeptidase